MDYNQIFASNGQLGRNIKKIILNMSQLVNISFKIDLAVK